MWKKNSLSFFTVIDFWLQASFLMIQAFLLVVDVAYASQPIKIWKFYLVNYQTPI